MIELEDVFTLDKMHQFKLRQNLFLQKICNCLIHNILLSSDKIFGVFTSLININLFHSVYVTETLVFTGTKLILARAKQIPKISYLYAPPHQHIKLF